MSGYAETFAEVWVRKSVTERRKVVKWLMVAVGGRKGDRNESEHGKEGELATRKQRGRSMRGRSEKTIEVQSSLNVNTECEH